DERSDGSREQVARRKRFGCLVCELNAISQANGTGGAGCFPALRIVRDLLQHGPPHLLLGVNEGQEFRWRHGARIIAGRFELILRGGGGGGGERTFAQLSHAA